MSRDQGGTGTRRGRPTPGTALAQEQAAPAELPRGPPKKQGLGEQQRGLQPTAQHARLRGVGCKPPSEGRLGSSGTRAPPAQAVPSYRFLAGNSTSTSPQLGSRALASPDCGQPSKTTKKRYSTRSFLFPLSSFLVFFSLFFVLFCFSQGLNQLNSPFYNFPFDMFRLIKVSFLSLLSPGEEGEHTQKFTSEAGSAAAAAAALAVGRAEPPPAPAPCPNRPNPPAQGTLLQPPRSQPQHRSSTTLSRARDAHPGLHTTDQAE